MKTRNLFSLLVLAGSLAVGQAQSSFTASLDGAQAGISSSGTGAGTLTLNLDNTVSYDISFSGLTGTTTLAHIHGPAEPGIPAGVVQGLTFVGGAGTTSGQLAGTTGALTPQQVTDMLNGLHYVNIHTSFAGGGEIRGQIYLVPEPTTFSLAALASLAGLLLWRTQRRLRTSTNLLV